MERHGVGRVGGRVVAAFQWVLTGVRVEKRGEASSPHTLLANARGPAVTRRVPGSCRLSPLKAYGLIFTPKVRTTEAEGVSVPMVALMVPAVPVAGAVTVLAGTVTAGLMAM
jgi:hypothetical protein